MGVWLTGAEEDIYQRVHKKKFVYSMARYFPSGEINRSRSSGQNSMTDGYDSEALGLTST